MDRLGDMSNHARDWSLQRRYEYALKSVASQCKKALRKWLRIEPAFFFHPTTEELISHPKGQEMCVARICKPKLEPALDSHADNHSSRAIQSRGKNSQTVPTPPSTALSITKVESHNFCFQIM